MTRNSLRVRINWTQSIEPRRAAKIRPPLPTDDDDDGATKTRMEMKPAQHRACEPTLIARPLLAASGELAREELISRAANLERPREMMFAQERRLSRPPIGSRASRTQAPATTTMADCCATTHTDRRISRDDRLGGSRVFFAITARSLLALERHCSAAGWLAGQSACADRPTDWLNGGADSRAGNKTLWLS